MDDNPDSDKDGFTDMEASESELMSAEDALGVRFPKQLRNCLLETDGMDDEYGFAIVWPLERIVRDNQQFRNNADFKELYMPFDACYSSRTRATVISSRFQFKQAKYVAMTFSFGTMRTIAGAGSHPRLSNTWSGGWLANCRNDRNKPKDRAKITEFSIVFLRALSDSMRPPRNSPPKK